MRHLECHIPDCHSDTIISVKPYMEMEFAFDVKWATLPTVSDAHRRPSRCHYKENESHRRQ